MKFVLGIVILVLVVILGAYFYYDNPNNKYGEVLQIRENTITGGDLFIHKKTRVLILNGAKLTVNGNLQIDGSLECEDNGLFVEVRGNLTVNDRIVCNRVGIAKQYETTFGIKLIVDGDINFNQESVVVSNSSIQVVNNINKIVTEKMSREVFLSDIKNHKIGPFVSSTSSVNYVISDVHVDDDAQSTNLSGVSKFSGSWYLGDTIARPPRRIQQKTFSGGEDELFLHIDTSQTDKTELTQMQVYLADGKDGQSVTGETCSAKGSDGVNGNIIKISGNTITVSNVMFFLGNGGNGGEAQAQGDCQNLSIADGGNGGHPGNFVIEANDTLSVKDMLTIKAGSGGVGGRAMSVGGDGIDGCSAIRGAKASAMGGNGGANFNKIIIRNVVGAQNIEIGDIRGGRGGDAKVESGSGGDGIGCNCNGGDGGAGVARGGNGGDAMIFFNQKIKRVTGFADAGGDGGNAIVSTGNGGFGGTCTAERDINNEQKGGNGGNGGHAIAIAGESGRSTKTRAQEKKEKNGGIFKELGDGGSGGSGCPAGEGGMKGSINNTDKFKIRADSGLDICI